MPGKPGMGNDLFMSVVIGTEDKINSIIGKLGNEKIHMHELANDVQNEIVSKLKFDDVECIALCLRLNRTVIINDIKNWKKVKSNNIPNHGIFTTFNYILWGLIQDRIKEFLKKHNRDIYDIVFQCDRDSIAFLKTAGLHSSYKGRAYVLSDIVAWANNRGNEPKGVIRMDLADEIKNRLKNKIRQRCESACTSGPGELAVESDWKSRTCRCGVGPYSHQPVAGRKRPPRDFKHG